MKKFILSLFALSTMVGSTMAQTTKRPLVEHFTQASCGPCASQNPGMYTILNNFGANNYTKVTYQVSWPGYDPMNEEYPAGPDARRTFYGVTGVPNVSVNGGATAMPNAAVTNAIMTAAAAETTDIELEVSHSYLTGRDIEVTVKVKNVSTNNFAAGAALHTALTEKTVNYATAPGTNGETDFFYVAREMFDISTGMPNTNGLILPAVNAGDSLVYTDTVTAPTYVRNYDEIGFAVFAQNNTSKEVYQSAYSEPIAIPTPVDVSTNNAVFGSTASGYCNTAWTPAFEVTNAEATAITSVEAQYVVGNNPPVITTLSGINLTQGQSSTVTFPATNLPTGSNNIEYSILSLNGNSPDFSAVNNTSLKGSSLILSPTAVGTSIATIFDGLPFRTTAPANAVADNPNNVAALTLSSANVQGLNTPLGGFGQSDGCFFWNCYGILNGLSSQIIYEKVDFSAVPNNQFLYLNWSHAHAQYNANTNDRLKVKISTDCGATWTTLWDKAGATLATTANPVAGNFFPDSTQWAANVVNLTPYIGQSEVNIAFEVISNYGNNIFIDDINTEVSLVNTTTAANNLTTEFTVYPNPVQNVMTLEFSLAEATDLNISITNALGQAVQQVANQTFVGNNNLTVNTSQLASGVYFINATTTEGVITKRFVINK